MLEHRFYGKIHPTEYDLIDQLKEMIDVFLFSKDLSVENLAFLSSKQALADLATFHEYFNDKYQVPSETRWISFGGSYPS